jgi:hypothetical protein
MEGLRGSGRSADVHVHHRKRPTRTDSGIRKRSVALGGLSVYKQLPPHVHESAHFGHGRKNCSIKRKRGAFGEVAQSARELADERAGEPTHVATRPWRLHGVTFVC